MCSADGSKQHKANSKGNFGDGKRCDFHTHKFTRLIGLYSKGLAVFIQQSVFEKRVGFRTCVRLLIAVPVLGLDVYALNIF